MQFSYIKYQADNTKLQEPLKICEYLHGIRHSHLHLFHATKLNDPEVLRHIGAQELAVPLNISLND